MKDEASRIKNQECRPLPSSNVLTWIAARMHQWRMTVLGLRTYVKRLCLHVSPTCTWANMVLCVHGVVSIHLAFPKPLDYCNRKSITDGGSLISSPKSKAPDLIPETLIRWNGLHAKTRARKASILVLDTWCFVLDDSWLIESFPALIPHGLQWPLMLLPTQDTRTWTCSSRKSCHALQMHHSSFIIHVPSLLQSGLLQSQEHNR